jgi:hypothetical protein
LLGIIGKFDYPSNKNLEEHQNNRWQFIIYSGKANFTDANLIGQANL